MVDGKLDLPPGRVQLIVQSLPDLSQDHPFWQDMRRIWDARSAAELAPRNAENVEAERRSLRREVDEDIDKARRLQEESAPSPRRGKSAQGKSMIVCLDANIVIYMVERNPHWEPKASARIAAFLADGDEIAVCDAACLECLVGPYQSGNAADIASYAAFFSARPFECCRLQTLFGKEPRRSEQITGFRLLTLFTWLPRQSTDARGSSPTTRHSKGSLMSRWKSCREK